MNEIVIDPEFMSLIPPLTEAEFNQLEENIVNDGVIRDPIVLWKQTHMILDGHNRFNIHKRHPEIPFTTVEKDFDLREQAIEWIYLNQIGRRNLTKEKEEEMIGRALLMRTKIMSLRSRDSEMKFDGSEGRASEKLAEELGMSETAVKRAGRFVRGLDEMEKLYPGVIDRITKGDLEVTKKDVMSLTTMDEEDKPKAIKDIVDGKRIQPDYKATPIATQMEHTGEYDLSDFRAELEKKITALDKGLELTLVLAHKDMLELDEGKEILQEILLRMIDVIKKYFAMC